MDGIIISDFKRLVFDKMEIEPTQDDQSGSQLQLSPVSCRISVERYLSTVSAKRRRVKQDDSRFCRASVSGKDLIRHLRGREMCRNL